MARGNAEKLFLCQTKPLTPLSPILRTTSSMYYADLSAFFYVWLKRIIGDLYSEHFTLSDTSQET